MTQDNNSTHSQTIMAQDNIQKIDMKRHKINYEYQNKREKRQQTQKILHKSKDQRQITQDQRKQE